MPLKYMAGEYIRKGDFVMLHGEPGQVEFIAESKIGDPEIDRYVTEFGGGVMILEPKFFGRAFLPEPAADEDLVLVSRASETSGEQSQAGPNTEK
jgi:hypothetical protein